MGRILSLTARDGLSAYRADPDGTPTAGIVVLQEIFGVNDHVRAVCDGFARDGHVAVAPALVDRVDTGIDLGDTATDMARGRAYKDRADTGQAIPISDVDKIRGSLETAPLRSRGGCEIHVYPDADHGFNCDHRATHHAAAQARDHTLAFFASQLG